MANNPNPPLECHALIERTMLSAPPCYYSSELAVALVKSRQACETLMLGILTAHDAQSYEHDGATAMLITVSPSEQRLIVTRR